MKKKTKFIMVAMALCLTVALGVLGIFAVKTLNMTVGGNITFAADGISFVVSDGEFKTTDNAEYTGIMTETTKLQGFEMNTNTKLSDVQDKVDSWTNLNLTMSSLGDAVLHFSITNNMTTETMYVYLDILHGENTNNNMSINQTGSGEAIAPSQTKAFTLTFDILDDSINAALTGFEVKMLFTRTQKVVPENQTPSGLIPSSPEQVESFVEPRMVACEPSLYFVSGSTRPTLLYKFTVTEELKQEIESNSNKKLAMILMPDFYYDRANSNNYTNLDWINALESVGLTKNKYIYEEIPLSSFYDDTEGYYFRFQHRDIYYANLFLRFTAMSVVVTTESDGSESYKYSDFTNGNDYRSNARSVADLVSNELNEKTLGTSTRTEEEYALLEQFHNECVDKANGLSSATNDGSKFEFSVNLGILQSYAVGVTVSLEVKLSPLAEVYAQYLSSNTNIVKVDVMGNITTISTGTATVSIYLFGQVKTVTITVA